MTTLSPGHPVETLFPIGKHFYVFRPLDDITAYEVAQIQQLFAASHHRGVSWTEQGAYLKEIWWDKVTPSIKRHFVVDKQIQRYQKQQFRRNVLEHSVIFVSLLAVTVIAIVIAVWLLSL